MLSILRCPPLSICSSLNPLGSKCEKGRKTLHSMMCWSAPLMKYLHEISLSSIFLQNQWGLGSAESRSLSLSWEVLIEKVSSGKEKVFLISRCLLSIILPFKSSNPNLQCDMQSKNGLWGWWFISSLNVSMLHSAVQSCWSRLAMYVDSWSFKYEFPQS